MAYSVEAMVEREGAVLFEGRFAEACEMIWVLPAEERADLSIVTGERAFSPDEVEALRGEAGR